MSRAGPGRWVAWRRTVGITTGRGWGTWGQARDSDTTVTGPQQPRAHSGSRSGGSRRPAESVCQAGPGRRAASRRTAGISAGRGAATQGKGLITMPRWRAVANSQFTCRCWSSGPKSDGQPAGGTAGQWSRCRPTPGREQTRLG